MIRRIPVPVAAFAAALRALAGPAGAAWAYHTNFTGAYCNYGAPDYTDYFTRDGSMTVALRARWEGYQWGGGCWNDDDFDESPGDPGSARTPAARGRTARGSRSRSGARTCERRTRAPGNGTCSATSTARTAPPAS